MSITKVKYIVIDHTVRKRVWIKRFINKLSLKIIGLSLKGDNKASFNFTKNLKSQY